MTRKLLALVDMGLRKSPKQGDPLWEEFYEWPAGTEFEPPAHLDIQKALARSIAAWADDPSGIAAARTTIDAMLAAAAQQSSLVDQFDSGGDGPPARGRRR